MICRTGFLKAKCIFSNLGILKSEMMTFSEI